MFEYISLFKTRITYIQPYPTKFTIVIYSDYAGVTRCVEAILPIGIGADPKNEPWLQISVVFQRAVMEQSCFFSRRVSRDPSRVRILYMRAYVTDGDLGGPQTQTS